MAKQQVLEIAKTKKQKAFELATMPEEILDVRAFEEWEHMSVASEEEQSLAYERIDLLAKRQEQVKSEQDFVIGPIDQHIKKLKKMTRDRTLNPLKRIESAIREAVGDYMTIKQRRQEAEDRKKAEEIARKKREEAEKIATIAAEAEDDEILELAAKKERQAEKAISAPVQKRPQGQTSSGIRMGTQTYYEWHLEDLSKVPKEFFVLDRAKLDMCARQYGSNPREIPGISWEKKVRPVRR